MFCITGLSGRPLANAANFLHMGMKRLIQTKRCTILRILINQREKPFSCGAKKPCRTAERQAHPHSRLTPKSSTNPATL